MTKVRPQVALHLLFLPSAAVQLSCTHLQAPAPYDGTFGFLHKMLAYSWDAPGAGQSVALTDGCSPFLGLPEGPAISAPTLPS